MTVGTLIMGELDRSADERVSLPEELLAESLLLLHGHLGGGEARALQALLQPLGQQGGTVSVQTVQHLRVVLHQAASSPAAHRLRKAKTNTNASIRFRGVPIPPKGLDKVGNRN